jgi:glycosyltransferase involved in cell wall biosynthesis
MKILFLTRRAYPKIGGVEKHIYKVSEVLKSKKQKTMVVGEKNIRYPHVKYLGLFSVWLWLLKNRKLIENANIVHCHDVFIWYLPYRFIFQKKKLVTTIHGYEWKYKPSINSKIQKRLAIKLSDRSVGIGHFLEKYIGKKFDLISYGAADIHNYKNSKDKKSIAYVGRLEENTGLLQFLKWLDKNPGYNVDFCGDGDLRAMCEKYGTVHGFTDPNPFYKKVKTVVPGGYLAALEALNSGCDIKLFWNNKVKEDYWKMSPFYKLKGEKLKSWARKQTWEKLANEYLDLYKEALNEKH